MPQIASNFILRSKLPNFERDSFYTLSEMVGVKSEWMDEGHISYCKEDNNHYIFYSDNGKLDGATRWTKLPTDESGTTGIRVVQSEDNLNKDLAEKIPVGTLVYVIGNEQYYYNVYQKSTESGQSSESGNNTYFRPLKQSLGLDNYVIKTEFETLKNNIETKLDDINEIKDNYITNDDLSNYATIKLLGDFEEDTLVEHVDNNYLKKDKLGELTGKTGKTYDTLVDYIEANYAPISEVVERERVLNLVTKGDLESYVKKIDLPSLDHLATTEQFDRLIRHIEDTYTTKAEAEETYQDLINKDTALESKFDAAVKKLEDQDTALESKFDAAVQDLINKDTALESKFDAAVKKLEDQDTALESKFDAAVKKLEDQDTALENKFDAAVKKLEDQDTALENKFDAAVQDLINKDTALESKFDNYYTKEYLDGVIEESGAAIQNLESKFDNQHKVLPQSEFDSIEDFSSYAEGTIFFTYKEDEQQ